MIFSDARQFRTSFSICTKSKKTYTFMAEFEGWSKKGCMFSGSRLAPSSLIIVKCELGPSQVTLTALAPVS